MRSPPDLGDLFAEHARELDASLAAALQALQRSGGAASEVLFDAGCEQMHPRDDQAVPFRPCPHLARWVPDAGPGDLLHVRPGETPHWFRVVPSDYWHEPRGLPDHPAVESFTIHEFATREEAVAAVTGEVASRNLAIVGPSGSLAERLDVPPERYEPVGLLNPLSYARSRKTSYELECIRRAVSSAACGHRAVARSLADRPSEYALHQAYLSAAELLDAETPYPGIVAWDDRAAILHYQSRRRTAPDPGSTLLIDAGASVWGYACDVTRTYVLDAMEAFVELLRGMDALQQRLVADATEGRSFIDLHAAALEGIAALLTRVGVLMASTEEALEQGWIDHFMPHGLGHHLGLQVHDVAGQFIAPSGELRPPPPRWPYLRTTRALEVGNVVTIEPGIYFMPTQLAGLRSKARGAFDWGLLRELEEYGGIRIEDDVWISRSGPQNLTRPEIP